MYDYIARSTDTSLPTILTYNGECYSIGNRMFIEAMVHFYEHEIREITDETTLVVFSGVLGGTAIYMKTPTDIFCSLQLPDRTPSERVNMLWLHILQSLHDTVNISRAHNTRARIGIRPMTCGTVNSARHVKAMLQYTEPSQDVYIQLVSYKKSYHVRLCNKLPSSVVQSSFRRYRRERAVPVYRDMSMIKGVYYYV